MIPVNVRILNESESPHPYPDVDGTTQKRVKFEILRTDFHWLFWHFLTVDGRGFHRLLDKLKEHGSVNTYAPEYKGDEPSDEWKDKVAWDALTKADVK